MNSLRERGEDYRLLEGYLGGRSVGKMEQSGLRDRFWQSYRPPEMNRLFKVPNSSGRIC
ncbi:MAG: hypothetical protein ACK4OO_03650 [bacterium]